MLFLPASFKRTMRVGSCEFQTKTHKLWSITDVYLGIYIDAL